MRVPSTSMLKRKECAYADGGSITIDELDRLGIDEKQSAPTGTASRPLSKIASPSPGEVSVAVVACLARAVLCYPRKRAPRI